VKVLHGVGEVLDVGFAVFLLLVFKIEFFHHELVIFEPSERLESMEVSQEFVTPLLPIHLCLDIQFSQNLVKLVVLVEPEHICA